VRVEVVRPGDVPPLRERLRRQSIPAYEADVRFAMRYLMERGIRGSLEIHGEPSDGPGPLLVFDEPELAPADLTPRLRVLSLDIETDPQARRLLAAALHGPDGSEVLLLTRPGDPLLAATRPFASEADLLAGLADRIRARDPDVITGWNVIEFDLAVLDRLARRARVPFELGRVPGPLRVREDRGVRGAPHADVPGRLVMDGIQSLRAAFVRMEDYGLDAVARSVLGEGKTLVSDGQALRAADRAGEILRLFEEDRERFVEYNRTDARLAYDVLQKLQIVELAVERSRLTGLPPDRVSGSIAAFDFLYLGELGRRGVVAPSVRSLPDVEPQAGGHVLDPVPGLYRHVAVLDFKSLYPSLIRTFGIDPLNLVRPEAGQADADAVVAPNGAAFTRQPGILPALLDELLPRRERARREGDEVKSHAIKILMNSFYGVLGTTACRFYDPRLANAITSFGRELLLWCRDRIEAGGRRVLYGDTDSLFVASGLDDEEAARGFGRDLAARLNRELTVHLRDRWRVESRLDLVFDRLYLRLCLPAMRHDPGGARKRYVGLVAGPGGPRLVFTGMEAVRSDWTELAKEVQRELYGRLFREEPVEPYLREVAARLRAGDLDDRLVYHKTLRKAPAAYTATTPPHVAAARRTGQERGRVAYVVTTAGPEPAESRRVPPDYDHYLRKQVGAVAEPVLALLGLDFEDVIGARKQLRLF
jgi:DNA polymerase-2